MMVKRRRFSSMRFHEDMENFEVREYGAGAPPSINFILFKFISEMIYLLSHWNHNVKWSIYYVIVIGII